MTTDGSEPLNDFPLLRTADPAEARDLMHRRFGVELITCEVAGFFARANLFRLPSAWLLFCASASSLQLLIAGCEFTQVHLLLRGRCSVSTGNHSRDFVEGETFVCSPGRATRLDYGPSSEALVLVLPPSVLARTLTVLTGVAPRAPLQFESAIPSDDPRHLGFRELLILLASRLDADFTVWPKPVVTQLELACITSLLHCSRHNYRRLLDAGPSDDIPACVRTAENYVETHGDANVSVDELAQAADVSVSTLSRAFLTTRGYSPAAFIKKVRLTRARKLLESGAASTVVGVALRCGFANPSRFANDYREAFGESPTETLRRSPLSGLDPQEH